MALEAGFALEAGLDGGLAGVSGAGSMMAGTAAAWDAGLEEGSLAFDAGLAYEIKHQMSQNAISATKRKNRTFFLVGVAASSGSPFDALRFFPSDPEFSSFSAASFSAASLSAFFALGFAGFFLGAGVSLGCTLMREERRGAADSSPGSVAALRGIVE